MNNNKKLKALALSLGLAALMAPATMDAQINRGLMQKPYNQDNNQKNTGMMNPTGNRFNHVITSNSIANDDFNSTAPLGGGIAILIGAGLGYVALKKKEDEQ